MSFLNRCRFHISTRGWVVPFFISRDELRELVREAVDQVFEGDDDGEETVSSLREQIETLRIEKGRREEEIARKEREITHKVGLERTRQEFEVEQAKRETTVTLREENLKADRERFTTEMAFTTERFKEEVGYLKDMVGKVLERLPSAEIIANVGRAE